MPYIHDTHARAYTQPRRVLLGLFPLHLTLVTSWLTHAVTHLYANPLSITRNTSQRARFGRSHPPKPAGYDEIARIVYRALAPPLELPATAAATAAAGAAAAAAARWGKKRTGHVAVSV